MWIARKLPLLLALPFAPEKRARLPNETPGDPKTALRACNSRKSGGDAMRKQTSTCLAIGFLLATVPQARAQEIVAPPVPAVPVAPAYTMPYQRGCSLKRI